MTLIHEFASEDPLEYKRHTRISVTKFEELLKLSEPTISKQDTCMRPAIYLLTTTSK